MKNFVIFDTEYTSWQGCAKTGWVLPQRKEIVQIAALKVDSKTFQVVDDFVRYIIPAYNPILSEYFINLTGITNEYLRQYGVDFKTAFNEFYKFAKGLDCYSYSCPAVQKPDADGEVMRLNLEFNGMNPTDLRFKNICFWFEKVYAAHNLPIENQASGQIAKRLGLEKNLNQLGLDEHNALYDVASILEGIRYFKGEGLF